MSKKKTAVCTFTYPDEVDLEKADQFIREWQSLGFHITIDTMKRHNIPCGLHIARSAALEGCYRAYTVIQSIADINELHAKGIVRMCVKNSFWTMCIISGYIFTCLVTIFLR